MHEQPPDPLFAEFVDSAIAFTSTDDVPVPDFGEVVARAHSIDPGWISAEQVNRAHQLASALQTNVDTSIGSRVVALPSDGEDDPDFDAFLADVRAEGIRASAVHLASQSGTHVHTTVAPMRSRSLGVVIGLAAMAAVAAVVFLFTAGGTGLLQRANDPTPSAAARDGASERASGPVQVHQKRAQMGLSASKPANPELSELPDVPAQAGPDLVDVASEPDEVVDKAEGNRGKRPRVDRLAELDAAAQEKWQNGDLEGAEALLRKVVVRGRRGRRVQLAYGDLFSLVRQLHGASGEQKLWREYLQAFPKGPHADDARAGLCRRAAAPISGDCWRDYLSHHPRGAHRQQALRALDTAAEPQP